MKNEMKKKKNSEIYAEIKLKNMNDSLFRLNLSSINKTIYFIKKVIIQLK